MKPSPILVLTRKPSNRISYAFRLILGELLGLDVRITQDKTEFASFKSAKFSYGVAVDESELYFEAHDLLFESGISVKKLNYIDFEGERAFFGCRSKNAIIPFDPFAASFYLVSRYEEYLPHIRDEHGRFQSRESEAFKEGFLQKAMVNRWALKIGEIISRQFPDVKISPPVYSFRPSFDIDAAYAFKHKGITRALGGFYNSIRRRSISEIKLRLLVLMNKVKDPFDTFDYLLKLQKTHNFRPYYFFLMADYGPRDKNIPVNNRQFLRLIKWIADYSDVGIHPSYASGENPQKLEVEISRLSKVLHQDITRSRQHFLRLEFPITYRNLINMEITDDFTMGYPDQPGFRASICTPFNFYDLDLDMETHLRIHPFAVMDGTLHDYMQLTPGQSIDTIRSLIGEIKLVGGTFIPLWHNQTLNDQDEWRGWLDVFEKTVELAKP